MTIKETALNIAIIVILLTGLVVSFMYSFEQHRKVKELQLMKDASEYQFIITDDSVSVYDYNRFVGTIKLDGSLDSLMIEDNQ
jgi:hypothetical protein